ncbi:hypothetical protein [Polaromonas sp. JS666]|uniref:hypothetical protein n=1 Tax=Polaromonas sp. (strain JS666 / ATCC BAA-500) TaxID=296591 RepID=UPI001587F3D6|nr:hypothetical protein [Polaromonas sp. JS666]
MIDAIWIFLQGLNPTNWIAIAALAVSMASFVFSWLTFRRDSPRLKIEARRYGSDWSCNALGYIEVKIMNSGRRPIYLTMLWGRGACGNSTGRPLDYGGPGIKLNEHEFKILSVIGLKREKDEFEPVGFDGDDDSFDFERIWIEDSLGKRHEIPGMKALLPALRTDYKEWCERTAYWKTPAPTKLLPTDHL